MGMTVFRAKRFQQRTGRNNWGFEKDRKMGVNKSNLRCYITVMRWDALQESVLNHEWRGMKKGLWW